jgi:hypothetical protein
MSDLTDFLYQQGSMDDLVSSQMSMAPVDSSFVPQPSALADSTNYPSSDSLKGWASEIASAAKAVADLKTSWSIQNTKNAVQETQAQTALAQAQGQLARAQATANQGYLPTTGNSRLVMIVLFCAAAYMVSKGMK